MPGTTSVPTAYVPSRSMVVIGPGGRSGVDGVDVGPAPATPAEGSGGTGGGVGCGQAPATPAEAPPAASINPAATVNLAATGASAFGLIELNRTGMSALFHMGALPSTAPITRQPLTTQVSRRTLPA